MMLLTAFLGWVEKSIPQEIVTFEGEHLFVRYAPFWPDEFHSSDGTRHCRPPWWRPFNLLFHCWDPTAGTTEEFHDHPRWSVTVCLTGRMLEMTPWGNRLLKPGSIVFRSRKAIHAFRVPKEWHGKTWTLFIVGRRNWIQSVYVVARQSGATAWKAK